MKNNWEAVDKKVYFGDLVDLYGRRILMIISNGVAVFARCTIEDYLVMKDDFDKLMDDFDFILGAKLFNGIVHFAPVCEEHFDHDMLEEIHSYLVKSV